MNLNLLGTREPEIYGEDTIEELMMWLETNPISTEHSFKFYQSNHEGEIIDIIHDERHWAQGISLILLRLPIIRMPFEMLYLQ